MIMRDYCVSRALKKRNDCASRAVIAHCEDGTLEGEVPPGPVPSSPPGVHRTVSRSAGLELVSLASSSLIGGSRSIVHVSICILPSTRRERGTWWAHTGGGNAFAFNQPT
jgi:hypothetical protein